MLPRMRPRNALILGFLGLLAFGAGYWRRGQDVVVLASSSSPSLSAGDEPSRPAAVVKREAALTARSTPPVKAQTPAAAPSAPIAAARAETAVASAQLSEDNRMWTENSAERWIFYPAVALANGPTASSLKGRVLWPGRVPAPLAEHRESEPYCSRFAPAEGRPPSVGLDSGVRDAVVWLAGAEAGPPPEWKAALVEFDKCSLVPRVQAARVGQVLEVVNRDPILHNLHAYLQSHQHSGTVLNKGLLPGQNEVQTMLDKPGVYLIRCDVHPWERANIVVTARAPAVLTSASGGFSFEGVTPGRYVLGAWEETAGFSTRRVELSPGESTADLHLNQSAFANR
jgi:hypothetical protein